MTGRCWIVTPVLRDVESFHRLRAEITGSLGEGSPRYLVVDDSAGTDPEMATLTGLDDVEVLTPPFNLGHQRAIVLGLRTIAGRLQPDDLVVTMDADGEDQPQDVRRLVDALESGSAPLVIARRTSRTESLRFRVMYLFFRVLFRTLTGTTVRSGNFAAQRAWSLGATIDHPSFDLCYSSSLLALARPTTFVPCARGHRFAGKSRMSSYGLIAHGIRMMLPFSERIAVRAFITSLASAVALAAATIGLALGGFGENPGHRVIALFIAMGAVFVTSLIGVVVLFAQAMISRGVAST